MLYCIIVLNAVGVEIDRQLIGGENGADALKRYIKNYNPTIEDGDTIKIIEC